MKFKLSLIVVVFISYTSFSQSFLEAYELTRELPPQQFNSGLTALQIADAESKMNWNSFNGILGVLAQFDDVKISENGFNGSRYLYKNWDNVAQITTTKNKFTVKNVNFDIERDQFVAKLKDSVFYFNTNHLKNVLIKNDRYLTVQNQNYKVEVVTKKFMILKKYSLKLIDGSPNPMVNRRKSTIKRRGHFYVFRDKELERIKLNKKSVLKLLDDSENAKEFAKKHKLSFKKISDVKKILLQLE